MIARVSEDYANLRFNTALAGLMEYVNGLNKAREEVPLVLCDPRFADAIDTLLVLLAPMAPHITEELWHAHWPRGERPRSRVWPDYDPELLVDDVITVIRAGQRQVARQAGGCPRTSSESELRELALASPKVKAASNGHDPKKVIYVPGRLINIVV